MSEISKLNPNSEYQIYAIKAFETTYGTSYILEDSEFNKYWSNSTVNRFIKQHKIKESDDYKLLFKIKTGPEREFKKAEAEVITFVETRCMK